MGLPSVLGVRTQLTTLKLSNCCVSCDGFLDIVELSSLQDLELRSVVEVLSNDPFQRPASLPGAVFACLQQLTRVWMRLFLQI